MNKVKSFAPTNIALAKYWGKRDLSLNLPTNSSLSVSLSHYGTETTTELDDSLTKDVLFINNQEIHNPSSIRKVETVLNKIRTNSKFKSYVKIESFNNFPTGAGLASSASGLAALTLSAAKTYETDFTLSQLSNISRMGSGSSCRSLFDGFVYWNKGVLMDGLDSIATSIAPSTHWELDATICIVTEEEKKTASTDGMILTQNTSLQFSSWIEFAEQSTNKIKSYILNKDFEALADEVELNCLRMHATALSAFPSILYFKPKTLDIIERVQQLRSKGYSLFFTIDAGPNVVIFSEPKDSNQILKHFSDYKILNSKVSTGAHYL